MEKELTKEELVYTRNLRTKAVKLVKARGGICQMDDDEVIREFMKYFNLTEEDLE